MLEHHVYCLFIEFEWLAFSTHELCTTVCRFLLGKAGEWFVYVATDGHDDWATGGSGEQRDEPPH